MAGIPAEVRINTATPFPSLITGQNGIGLGKTNGIWTVGLNTPSLQTGALGPADFANNYVAIYDSVGNRYAKVSLATVTGIAGTGPVYLAPTTGFTYTMTGQYLIIDPAGMLASGSVTLMAAPLNGQLANIRSTQPISSFSIVGGGGQTVKAAPVTLAAGQVVEGIFLAGTSTWYFGL